MTSNDTQPPLMTHTIPRAVVFDLDGLIFNTEALFYRVASEMLAARGKRFTPEIMAAMIGRRAVDAGEAFRRMSGLEEPVDVLMAEARARFMAELDTAVHPTPGLFVLIEHIERAGLPRAVATSSRREYAEGLLKRHGLLDRFMFVLTGDDVTHGKPDPEIYLKAAARLDVAPERLIVLEDSAPGLTAARAAGAFAVGVPHEHSPAASIRETAHLVVPRLDDPALLRLVDQGTFSP